MTSWPELHLWVHLNATASDPVDPATGGNWTDIGAYVQGFSTMRGSSRFDGVLVRYEAGTSSFALKNTDARFDPLNLSGPYVSGGVTQVQPGRAFGIQATWSGVTYKLWRGFADSWDPQYQLHGLNAVTMLNGSDTLALWARTDLQPFDPEELPGAGVNTATRVSNWAFFHGYEWWHDPPEATDGLNIEEGFSTPIQPAGEGGTLEGNVLAGMQLAVDTEIGELYTDGNAKLIFRNRQAIHSEARSATSQATFQPGTSLPFDALDVSYDAQPVRNHVAINRVGGTLQIAEDTASQAAYGKRTFSRTDLLHETNGESADYASYILNMLKSPELRIDSISINPQAAPATLFPQVLGRELGDRITIAFTPPGGSAISRPAFIRGISHQVTPNRWMTRWILQDASRFDQFLLLDDATRGLLDTNRLGY